MNNLIILGLGCNLGDRKYNLRQAMEAIQSDLLDNIKSSSVFPCKAMLPKGAPDSWDIDFYNIVVSGTLRNPEITPEQFLFKIKLIEANLGRKPTERWAPREMDIDILAWGDEVIKTEHLTIPHSGITGRDFVIIPLAQIHPDWQHPQTQITAHEYAQGMK